MKTNDPRLRKAINNNINCKIKEDFELMGAFAKLHHIKTGALSTKYKKIIALGIAISTGGDKTISPYIHKAIKNGASREQIVEVMNTAIYMGGISHEVEDDFKLMAAFSKLHYKETGALSTKHKEIIALAIAISTGSDRTITTHIHKALKNGASRAEIVETIGTAIYMGGNIAVALGAKAFSILKKYDKKEINS